MPQPGRTTTGRVRLRAALVLALLYVAALCPVPLAPAGAEAAVVSTALLPFDGLVGEVSLTGVVHVVTRVEFTLSPDRPLSRMHADRPCQPPGERCQCGRRGGRRLPRAWGR